MGNFRESETWLSKSLNKSSACRLIGHANGNYILSNFKLMLCYFQQSFSVKKKFLVHVVQMLDSKF